MYGSVDEAVAATRFDSFADVIEQIPPEVRERVRDAAARVSAISEEAAGWLADEAARIASSDEEDAALRACFGSWWALLAVELAQQAVQEAERPAS